MSLSDNIKSMASNMQQGAKNASISLSQRLLRLVSGFFVGIVLSLIIQEFTKSGTLMLVFFTVLFTMIIFRLLRQLSILQIFVFDIICILAAVAYVFT